MAVGCRSLVFILSFAVWLSALSSIVSAHATHHGGVSPFGFIEKLGGCHRGEKNVTHLHKLKAYLNRFGYACTRDHSHDNDDFDASLEAAIKAYQMNYRLKPTGVLDKETVDQMMVPRCGYPDTVNRTVQQASGMMKKKSSGSLRTVSHYSFFPNRPRWPLSQTNLRFAFLPGVPDSARQPVFNAFGQWDVGSRFTFQYVTDSSQADLTVGFYSGDHGDGSGFDGPGGVLAHAFAPTNGRMHFDATENWSRDPTPGAFHLETVAVHEIGHLLGLGHSQVREAVMFSGIPTGVNKLLHADDREGVRVLYS
uniref:Peptidase metallopeptidase domain-containing protein n=1 Tax=Kalanchoe fedtschenkoi TaxID=63787 RepID=A0A7N0VD19_KALFE